MIIKIKSTLEKLLNNETILYIFFGILTTIISIVSFSVLNKLSLNYKVSNILSLVLTKSFAYITNKLFVFKTKSSSLIELLMEMGRFIIARSLSGIFDFVGLIVAVEWLLLDPTWSKIIIQFIVIGVNYFLSKILVFKKKL